MHKSTKEKASLSEIDDLISRSFDIKKVSESETDDDLSLLFLDYHHPHTKLHFPFQFITITNAFLHNPYYIASGSWCIWNCLAGR